MKKKTVLITVSIILLMSTLAWALWPAIVIRSGLRLATSQGAKRVVVQAGLPQVAARQVARTAVVQNKTDLAWKVGNTAAALLGITYLVSDISGLRQEILVDIPDIYTQTAETTILQNGVQLKIEGPTIPASAGYGRNNVRDWHEWRVYESSGKWKVQVNDYTTVPYADPYEWGHITVSIKQPDGGWSVEFENLVVTSDYSYQVVPINTAITDTVTEGTYDVIAIDGWVDDHPQAFIDPGLVTNTLSDTAPSGAQDMGETNDVTIMDEYPADPETGAVEDPLTGLDQSPVENPADVTDTYTAPSQPDLPIFDTTMNIPEKQSIPDKITDFLNNAPFMNVINNFQVTASSGSSILTFTVWGRSYQWDFAEFEDFYNMMAAVLLALAYIWSAQIVFGGRA